MPTPLEELTRLLDTQEAAVKQAFTEFVASARSDAVIAEVVRALERGDVEAAYYIADQYILRMGNVFPKVFEASGIAATAELAAQLAPPRIGISFDPTHPRAAQLMRENQLAFIRGFTAQQRDATRAALVEALNSGAGPRAAAAAYRDSIGLTEYQIGVVNSYRRSLEALTTDALSRQLRDRRFDRLVERLLDESDILSSAQIERMVNRYFLNMLALRAETIARTETQKILNTARQESIRQSLEQTGVSPDLVTRIWRSTHDNRTRDTHVEMDEQRRGMDEPFESPSGARLRFPGDPNAPPEEIINCRCVVLIEVARPVRIEA